VEAQNVLDATYKPFETALVDAVRAQSARRILDVGCGTGATTLALARVVGEPGVCVGVDVSEPMLALARDRAQRENASARFIHADAQTHAFEPGAFDMVVSRFGVMFFDEPVEAFANLRRAVRAGGRLRFIAWRAPADNPFMTVAEQAAAHLLPDLATRPVGAQGPFAFADPRRIADVLDASGWKEVEVAPIDGACTMPEAELAGVFTRLGPVGAAYDQADTALRTQIVEAVRPAFDSFVQAGVVRYTAACWSVSAASPGA
jgi:ubiquinone/menaquinone biosynthesis C-methylase UbiE